MTSRRKDATRKTLEVRALEAASALEPTLGHKFSNPALLARALTHPSADGAPARNNQRLEFLGDRVLGLVVATLLYCRFPAEAEGSLARRFSALVRGETLARLARTLGLGPVLVLGASEIESDGQQRPAGLANAFEAVIAALYLDGGFAVAERFVLAQIEPLIDESMPPPKDPKTALQEWAQARKRRRPAYQIVTISGEPHAPRFEVEVTIDGLEPVRAAGASKREAEQAAALALLDNITAVDHG